MVRILFIFRLMKEVSWDDCQTRAETSVYFQTSLFINFLFYFLRSRKSTNWWRGAESRAELTVTLSETLHFTALSHSLRKVTSRHEASLTLVDMTSGLAQPPVCWLGVCCGVQCPASPRQMSRAGQAVTGRVSWAAAPTQQRGGTGPVTL